MREGIEVLYVLLMFCDGIFSNLLGALIKGHVSSENHT